MSITRQSLLKDVSTGMYWSTILSPISAMITITISIALIRVLGPTNYGIWVTVNSIVATIALYSSLGMHKGLSRFMPEVKNRFGKMAVAKFFKTVFLIQAAIAILAIGIAGSFSTKIQEYLKLGESSLTILTFILIAAAIAIFFNCCSQGLASFFKQKELNLITLFISVTSAILVIAFVALGFGVRGILGGFVISMSLGLLLTGRSLWSSIKSISDKDGLNNPVRKGALSNGVYQRMAKFSLLNYFLDIGNYFFQLPIIVFILLIFNNQKEVAIFALGYNLVVNIKDLLLVPYRTTMSPLFANISAADTRIIKKAYDFLTKLIIVTFVPVGFGFILLCKNLVELFYSKLFLASTPIAQVLMAGLVIEFTMTISETLLLNYEHYKSILFSKSIALINLPLLLFVVPRYGLLGAAIATSVVRLMSKTSLFLYSLKRFEISFPVVFLQKVLLSSCIFTALIWLETRLINGYIAPIIVSIITGIFVFLIALKLLKGFSDEDRQLIAQSAIPFKKMVLNFI